MNYRELQKQCKSAGMSAKGSRVELEERLGIEGRSFVFVGDVNCFSPDPNNPRDPCDPPTCIMHGYTFRLNGDAVTVSDDVAGKFETHSHFTEK